MTTRAVEAWTLEPLVTFVKEAGARLVLVMTSAGQVMAQHGFSRAVDVSPRPTRSRGSSRSHPSRS